jgi:nucleoside 2-deoxyribosyltransferase
VETRSLAIPPLIQLKDRQALKPKRRAGRIYLAGPFFDIAKRWLVEETLAALESMGADVFSPLHDVGFGSPLEVATQDLVGLEGCSAVLALIDGHDPGTLFEIGYAAKKSIPVVALAENVSETDLTMLLGTGCEVVADFASAVYRAIWMSSFQ